MKRSMGLWMATALVVGFTERERFAGKKLVRDSIIASLAFAYSFWTIYGSGEETIAKGFLLLMAGIPVYLYLRWRQSRDGAPVVAPTPLEPTVGAEPKLVEAGQ